MLVHKNCGGKVVTKRCDWDDMFDGCAECDQHEYCDNWETINVEENENAS